MVSRYYMKVPHSHQDRFLDETRAFAYLGTVMENVTPHVTPVWFNTESELILINSQIGRVKDHNIRERPNVSLLITDPEDPYRYLMVRGPVVEITEKGAREHIDILAKKYTGVSRYEASSPDAIRVIYKISPVNISVL